MNCSKENLTREEVNKLVLASDNEGRTVFHKAAMSDEKDLFQEILNYAKKSNKRGGK